MSLAPSKRPGSLSRGVPRLFPKHATAAGDNTVPGGRIEQLTSRPDRPADCQFSPPVG